MIDRIEAGDSIPTFHVGARLAYGVDKTLTEFIETMEDGGKTGRQGDLERGRKRASEMSD